MKTYWVNFIDTHTDGDMDCGDFVDADDPREAARMHIAEFVEPAVAGRVFVFPEDCTDRTPPLRVFEVEDGTVLD